jgi:adenosylcobinamide kinase/adenosylcobinamide-phosphate guanylyltransferase
MSLPNSAKIPSSNTTMLILGGARSGKSAFAEKQAIALEKELIYIATAKTLDKETEQRVARHKEDRAASNWITIEEPIALANTLKQWASPERVILVDCLTMWLTNLLSEPSAYEEEPSANEEEPSVLDKEIDEFLTSINTLSGTVIFVSNEVGMGIIPMGELTRKYVDEAGRLHQRLAQKVEQVILMVAGLPHIIKPSNFPNEI